MSPRRLVYVMGASGSGKDSLLRYARERLAGSPVVFARRHVTRPAEAGGEDHIPVSREHFRKLRQQGRFAMHWEANGLCYGVGAEIDAWMTDGLLVVVNGSRGAYPEVLRRYPRMLAVLVTAPDGLLRERLLARGREDEAAVRARLERSRRLAGGLPGVARVANDGSLAAAGGRLVRLIAMQMQPIRHTPAGAAW